MQKNEKLSYTNKLTLLELMAVIAMSGLVLTWFLQHLMS